MSAFEISGYIAAILMFATFYVKMMVPLRIIGICTNVAFFTYGVLGGLTPIIILHTVLLPVNAYRLYQMLRHTRDARRATEGELNLEWLKPYGSSQKANVGDIVFRRGDTARDMFVVNSGRFRLQESGLEIGAQQIVVDLAFLSPERRRMQTLECVEAGTLMRVGYSRVEQLYFQNPRFGFYVLKLITLRLTENVERLEEEVARYRKGAPA